MDLSPSLRLIFSRVTRKLEVTNVVRIRVKWNKKYGIISECFRERRVTYIFTIADNFKLFHSRFPTNN